jgi:hypothetical protein
MGKVGERGLDTLALLGNFASAAQCYWNPTVTT